MPKRTEGKMARFNHHPNPAIDFCVEVGAIEGMVADVKAGYAEPDLTRRYDRAMQFNVGGDEGCVLAKSRLRAIRSFIPEPRS